MSRKNFKVDTAANGQTIKQDTKHIFVVEKTNVPTGKVKTTEDREKRRKAREEQYKTFRVNALKRRAKRMKLSEEETEAKIKELLTQLDTPNSYDVILFFNPSNADFVRSALQNEGIAWKIMSCNQKGKSDGFALVDANQETLGTLRAILPPETKIHPYVKKKKPVLAAPTVKKEKKPSNNNKNVAHAAKIARKTGGKFHKRPNVAGMSKQKRKEFKAKVLALKASWKARKKTSGTTVHMKTKKGSTAPKNASTLKEAA